MVFEFKYTFRQLKLDPARRSTKAVIRRCRGVWHTTAGEPIETKWLLLSWSGLYSTPLIALFESTESPNANRDNHS